MMASPVGRRGRTAARRLSIAGGGHGVAPRVHRSVERRVDAPSGLERGHHEVAMVRADEHEAAVAADPSLAGFAWTRVGDRMVGRHWIPRAVVTPRNIDTLLAEYAAATERRDDPPAAAGRIVGIVQAEQS